MESRIDRYRRWAATCATTAYDSEASVREHNSAATMMRELVAEPGTAEELFSLLDEPETAKWLAFHLLEICQPQGEVRDKCLAIVRQIAAGSGMEALGAQYWLRDFKG